MNIGGYPAFRELSLWLTVGAFIHEAMSPRLFPANTQTAEA